mmetsp:Transcript_10274/g.29311  ORF Transcript_10274/g.29311 Transcript_10274/m.29311 type:complete len:270 (-) Transcript_10274:98-907(-)
MLSGYGQPQATTHDICSAVDRFVSAFLGVRFPMALALNKCDLPSSRKYVSSIVSALPVHGAHVATPMTAKHEMQFIRKHLLRRLENRGKAESTQMGNVSSTDGQPTRGTKLSVWDCLTAAITLKEPTLVFPVSDFNTLAPMSGMHQPAIGSPSLPSPGMIACIEASGGCPPSLWNPSTERYSTEASNKRGGGDKSPLRDALLLKPRSTVEDVFLTLKRMGALSGDFVRAEACSGVLDGARKPKPIPKHDRIGRHNRIIRIQTTKRAQWQ